MKRYILIVDGIGKTKLELAIMLKKYNVEIIHVKDIVGAIAQIVELKNSIKLIIFDLDDDNLELDNIKSIKEKEICRDIPLIIVSHHKEKKFILNSIQAGAVEYIVKPFTEEFILNKLNEIIGITLKNSEEIFEESFDKDDSVIMPLKDVLSIHFKSMSRGNYPLSIIIFKLIDTKTSKESKRKQVLSIIIKAIKSKLRETDIIINYYDDNILILLPFTDNYGANLVEKKIREHFLENSMLNQKADGFILASSLLTLPDEGRDKNYVLVKLKSSLKPSMFFSKTNYE